MIVWGFIGLTVRTFRRNLEVLIPHERFGQIPHAMFAKPKRHVFMMAKDKQILTAEASRFNNRSGCWYQNGNPGTLKQGYGVVNDPFENAPSRNTPTRVVGISMFLDFRPETTIFIFHTICMAGQHKSNFYWYLHCFVKPRFLFFFRRFFAPKRMFDKKDTGMFICTRCVASSMYCAHKNNTVA